MTAYRGPLNVLDMGAKGDGVTDDTDAIQAAINVIYERGGGTVFFPFMPKGYRLAKPAPESVNGFPVLGGSKLPFGVENVTVRFNLAVSGRRRSLCRVGENRVKFTGEVLAKPHCGSPQVRPPFQNPSLFPHLGARLCRAVA